MNLCKQLATLSPKVPDCLDSVTIGFDPGCRTPFVEYAIELISEFCGINVIRGASRGRVDVYYGEDCRRPCTLRIPKLPAYSSQTVPGIPSKKQTERAKFPLASFPFD